MLFKTFSTEPVQLNNTFIRERYSVPVADSKGGTGRPPPYWFKFFSKKPPFSVQKAYRSLCAFAINTDGADRLSSAHLLKIFGSATVQCVSLVKPESQKLHVTLHHY